MSLVSNNSQFAGGNANSLNFSGTDFTADNTLNAPQTAGNGTQGANSSWIPTIYSKKVLKIFRTASVAESITNNDYYGEIANYGDSVIIIKEPKLDIVDYARGEKLTSQVIDSDSMNLVLDQAKAFQFQVEDIEKKLSHIEWQGLAVSAAAYDLKNDYDKAILGYMAENVSPANIITSDLGTVAIAASPTGASAFATIAATGDNVLRLQTNPNDGDIESGVSMDPLDLLNKFNLRLDIAEVPEESRWVVVDPAFLELAMRMDSNLMNRDTNSDMASIKNGLVNVSPIRGLKMYKTNNAPKLVATLGTGVTTARPQTDGKLNDEGRILLAGHMTAVATATAIVKTETFRSHSGFADVVRGLHVYGRGVVRAESLVAAAVTYKAISI